MSEPPVRTRAQVSKANDLRLPGMELLGFYDQPYQVVVNRPRKPPRAASVVTALHRTSTTVDPKDRVSNLWQTTEVEESALDWWKPEVIARRKLGGRRVRVTSLVVGFVAVVGLILAAASLLQRPERQAEESRQVLTTDVRALLGTLTPLEQVTAGLGSEEPPDLAGSTETALATESAARQLFTDSGALEDRARDDAVEVAGGLLDATARINQLIAYRLSAEQILEVPGLHTSPSETELAAATETVANWRAEVETGVDELPGDVLSEHRTALDEWLASLEAWQAAYLDGLRQENADSMSAEVDELQTQMGRLHDLMLEELSVAGGEIRGQIGEARTTAEALLGS